MALPGCGDSASLQRRAYAAAGSLVALVGEGHHVGTGQRIDDAVGAGSGQVVRRAGGGYADLEAGGQTDPA